MRSKPTLPYPLRAPLEARRGCGTERHPREESTPLRDWRDGVFSQTRERNLLSVAEGISAALTRCWRCFAGVRRP